MQAKLILLAGGALLGSGTAALASGFQVNLAGQRNIGMGGVGVGLSLDQAAMFYNPGALARVAGNGVQVGANLAMPKVSFRSQSGSGEQRELRDQNVTPLNFYAGFGPKSNKFKIGIAGYTPFGSELHYADQWEGRYSLTDIKLRSVFAQLTGSVAIGDKLSVGAGLVMLAFGDVDLQRDVPQQEAPSTANPTPQPYHATLTGTAKKTFGYNVGVLYKASDKFSVGASYRSKIDAKIENGDVGLRNIIGATKAAFTATNFSVTLPLPATASIGFGYTPNEKLTVGLDANYVFWNEYKSLDFTYSGDNHNGDVTGANGVVTPGTPGLLGNVSSSSSKREYKDALAIRLGGQYKVTSGLALRAGGFYDFHAVKPGSSPPKRRTRTAWASRPAWATPLPTCLPSTFRFWPKTSANAPKPRPSWWPTAPPTGWRAPTKRLFSSPAWGCRLNFNSGANALSP